MKEILDQYNQLHSTLVKAASETLLKSKGRFVSLGLKNGRRYNSKIIAVDKKSVTFVDRNDGLYPKSITPIVVKISSIEKVNGMPMK